MKIIEVGKIKNQKIIDNPYQGQCSACKCVFVYSIKDTKRMNHSKIKHTISCPTCSEMICILDIMPNIVEL